MGTLLCIIGRINIIIFFGIITEQTNRKLRDQVDTFRPYGNKKTYCVKVHWQYMKNTRPLVHLTRIADERFTNVTKKGKKKTRDLWKTQFILSDFRYSVDKIDKLLINQKNQKKKTPLLYNVYTITLLAVCSSVN